jgi:hypothetical protein
MFGPFRITNPLNSGLLWYVLREGMGSYLLLWTAELTVHEMIDYRKIRWRLSKHQKYRHRQRLRAVDNVVSTIDAALAKKGQTLKQLERWKAEMPTEAEMLPKDKYTIFDRKEKRYRKAIHSTWSGLARKLWDRSLTMLQSCRNGREYHNDLTLLDSSLPDQSWTLLSDGAW